MTRRLTREEWAYEIARSKHVKSESRKKLKHAKFRYFERVLSRWMPVPIVLGVVALVLLVVMYGWREFFKFLLAWTVSLTLVATGAYYLWQYYEKKL